MSSLGGGLFKRGTYRTEGGAQSFQGEQSGDHSSLTEYKDCHLTANGGGGRLEKIIIILQSLMGDQLNVIDTQSKSFSPPPPQVINSDPLQSSLMHLNRIDLQIFKFFFLHF